MARSKSRHVHEWLVIAKRSIIALILAIGSATSASAASQAGVAAIFMYHHVSPHVQPGPYARDLTVTPREFHDQLAWLAANGCRVVTVDELHLDVERETLARCEAALTFDDGYADVATYALPLLLAFKDKATFYIATGYVGSEGHVSLAQLRSLHGAGMEIGAHTVHHLDLTTMPRADAAHEINASAAALRARLRTAVTSFAYPAGRFNAWVVARVRAAGFENAVTTDPGNVGTASDPWELPRYRIERGTGLRLMEVVFPEQSGGEKAPLILTHIARQRIAGNAPGLAEDVAVALLARGFPEQILKVHVVALRAGTVAGIVLSGVKFHKAVDRVHFAADVEEMIELTFHAAPSVGEVDVWATLPVAVSREAPASGDYAVPTSKTVFSAAVTRRSFGASGAGGLGATYWDPQFLR